MPSRHKTSSWQCTVAGILSVNCPSLFCSGTQTLGESGWWSLQQMTPPKLKDVLKSLSGIEHCPVVVWSLSVIRRDIFIVYFVGDRTRKNKQVDLSGLTSSTSFPVTSQSIVETVSLSRKRSSEDEESLSAKKIKEDQYILDQPSPSMSSGSADVTSILALTERQEMILLNHLSHFSATAHKEPCIARLICKLKVRQKKRELGLPIFNLDKCISQFLAGTDKYVSTEQMELPIPLKKPVDIADDNKSVSDTSLPVSTIAKARSILRRLSVQQIPLLSRSHTIKKRTSNKIDKHVISPYTSRILTPFIFKSSDFLPPKVQILKELVSKLSPDTPYKVKPVSFCYFQEQHLPSINSLISYFFWSVDLTEYLQYPDFTVVVLYEKLVIGCGFMTPDVKISEAYIPFLLVHPDFQRCGIGQIMLYHLIQSCQGKDVTLHVSVDNSAMLLYQKFGFKVEQFCMDFYDKYYPPNYHLSKHAFLMRLRR